MNKEKQKEVDEWLNKLASEEDEEKLKENIEFMKGLSF